MNPSHEAAMFLLEKARGDRLAFNTLISDPMIPLWLIGFHAQQAVEKSLKSVLVSASVEYPRTHNISMLIGLLSKFNLPLPSNAEALSLLTPFGVVFRYDDTSLIDDTVSFDPLRAKQIIDETIIWAESYINLDKAT
jgi:hypothetical protein